MTKEQKKFKLTYKTSYYFVLAVVLISFVPLLFISKYNHMSADDYSYGLNTHKVWQETGNIIKTVKTAGITVTEYYDSWQGTFTSIFLMALQPGVFGEQYYPIGAVALICLYAVSFYIFGHVMLTRLFHADKYQAGIVTLIMLCLCTQWMQAPVQAFYFYNAGVHYIFMFAMMLLALSLQIILVTSTKKQVFSTVAGAVLAFIVGGGNYITAFLYLLLTISILFVSILSIPCIRKKILGKETKGEYNIYRKQQLTELKCKPDKNRKKTNISLQLVSIFAFLCSFFISVMAPGNSVRGDKFEDITPIGAIRLAFKHSIEGCNIWMTLSIVCVFIFLIPLVVDIVQKTDFSFPMPGLVVVYAYCLFAAMYAPTCYALGFPGAGRCRNIYRMVYYIMLLFDMIYVLGYANHKLKSAGLGRTLTKVGEYFVKRIWKPFGIITVGFFLFIVLNDDWNSYASLSAVKSVWEKEAQLYHVQSLEREELLRRATENIVEVPGTSTQPKLLFFDDITTDSSDWRNKYMAKWYGKKKVILVGR